MNVDGMLKKLHKGMYQKTLLYFCLALFCYISSAIYMKSTSFDTCAMDYSSFRKDTQFQTVSGILFYSTVAMVFFFLLQLSVWKRASWTATFDGLFSIAFTILWFIMTFLICTIGKFILSDHNCAQHPNSISGHYAFHVYYMLALPHLYMTLEHSVENAVEANNEKRHLNKKKVKEETKTLRITKYSLLLGTYVVLVLTSFGTLTRTWMFGFHTLRQISYGTMLAIVSHYIAVLLQTSAIRTKTGPLVITSIVTFGLLLFGLVVTRYSPLPLSKAELLLSNIMWVIIASYSWSKYSSKEKRQ